MTIARRLRQMANPGMIFDLKRSVGRVAFARATPAPYIDGSGSLAAAAAGQPAPFFEHSAGHWVRRGVTNRTERLNVVDNQALAGLVPGRYGSGLVAPTDWTFTMAGGGTNINWFLDVTSGAEDGIPYIQLALSGTPTSAATPEINIQPCAPIQWPWVEEGVLTRHVTAALHLRLMSGSMTGLTMTQRIGGLTSAGAIISSSGKTLVPTADPLSRQFDQHIRRFTTAVSVTDSIRIVATAGVPCTAVIRIALPAFFEGWPYRGPVAVPGSVTAMGSESYFLQVEPGIYDCLIEGSSKLWLDGVTVGAPGLPIPSVGFDNWIGAASVYRTGALSQATKNAMAPVVMPTTFTASPLTPGTTIDGSNRCNYSPIAGTTSAVLRNTGSNTTWPTVGTDANGTYFEFSGSQFFEIYDPLNEISFIETAGFAVGAVFRANSTSAGVILGQENVTNAFFLAKDAYAKGAMSAGINGVYVDVTPQFAPFSDAVVAVAFVAKDHFRRWSYNAKPYSSQFKDYATLIGNSGTKYVGRRAAATQMFNGKLYQLAMWCADAITPAQELLWGKEAVAAHSILTLPPQDRMMWAGGNTDTSFKVRTDVTFPVLQSRGVVATSPSSDDIVWSGPAVPTKSIAGFQETILYTGFEVPEGTLQPRTYYWYNFAFNGVVDETRWRKTKTWPTPGTPASGRVIYMSCADVNGGAVAEMIRRLPDLDPDFVMMDGDAGYTNVVNKSRPRALTTSRRFQQCPDVDDAARFLTYWLGRHDHDGGGGNDGFAEKIFASGDSFAEIRAAGRWADRMMFPQWRKIQEELGETNPELIVDAYELAFGRFQILRPDANAFMSHDPGNETTLGGTQPHVFWNQKAEIFNRLRTAGARGFVQSVFVSTSTMFGTLDNSWQVNYGAELTELFDVFGESGVLPTIIPEGDAHQVGFSDRLPDASTSGEVRVPRFMASGVQRGSALTGAGPFIYGGVDTHNTTTPRVILVMDFRDTDQHANPGWHMSVYKLPPVQGDPLVKILDADSEDFAVEVAVEEDTPSIAAADPLEIVVTKGGFGQPGRPASVDWSISGGGPSGTIDFAANRIKGRATVPGGTLPAGSYSITLSNAVNCEIAGTNPASLTVA